MSVRPTQANLQIIAQGDNVPNENMGFHAENQLCFRIDSEPEQFNFKNSCYVTSTSEELSLPDEWDPSSSIAFISNEDNDAAEELFAPVAVAPPGLSRASDADLTMPETNALQDSPEEKPESKARDIDAQQTMLYLRGCK